MKEVILKIPCEICGKIMEVTEKHGQHKKYCSKECKQAGIRERYHERMESRSLTDLDKNDLIKLEAIHNKLKASIAVPEDGVVPETTIAELENKYGRVIFSKFIGNNLVCIFFNNNKFFWKSFFGTRKILESTKQFETLDKAQKDVVECFI